MSLQKDIPSEKEHHIKGSRSLMVNATPSYSDPQLSSWKRMKRFLKSFSQKSKFKIPKNCVVCNSPFVTYMRHVPTILTKEEIPLFSCMNCQSFFNPSNYVPSERDRESELDFHIRVIERNRQRSEILIADIKKRFPEVKTMVEIGCSVGTFVDVARKHGIDCIGYDVNQYAIEYGQKEFGLGDQLRAELWDPSKNEKPIDLLLSIHVLEHFEQPRDLFLTMAESARADQGKMYVSVPFFQRNRWRYILDPNPKLQGTPFFNNDVHVTHFSPKGLNMLAEECGSQQSHEIQLQDSWYGFVFDYKKPSS